MNLNLEAIYWWIQYQNFSSLLEFESSASTFADGNEGCLGFFNSSSNAKSLTHNDLKTLQWFDRFVIRVIINDVRNFSDNLDHFRSYCLSLELEGDFVSSCSDRRPWSKDSIFLILISEDSQEVVWPLYFFSFHRLFERSFFSIVL